MNKRGQMQISFGMIFSIIIIIATIAIGAYAISSFVRTSKCADVSLFYDSLKKRVDAAWKSPITSDTLTGKLPSGIESVCFGNLSQNIGNTYKEQYDALWKYKSREANVFLYPLANACSNSAPYYKLEHVSIQGFFCIDVKSGSIKVTLKKDETDALVKLS